MSLQMTETNGISFRFGSAISKTSNSLVLSVCQPKNCSCSRAAVSGTGKVTDNRLAHWDLRRPLRQRKAKKAAFLGRFTGSSKWLENDSQTGPTLGPQKLNPRGNVVTKPMVPRLIHTSAISYRVIRFRLLTNPIGFRPAHKLSGWNGQKSVPTHVFKPSLSVPHWRKWNSHNRKCKRSLHRRKFQSGSFPRPSHYDICFTFGSWRITL